MIDRLSAGLVVALAASSAWPATKTDTPDLNYSGQATILVDPLEADGQLWLEVRVSGIASHPNDNNGFGANAVVLAHTYFRLTVPEAEELAAGLEAWAAEPHSDTVFRVPGPQIGISFSGNAWNPTFAQVVIVNIQLWIQQERGHIHGGNYFALTHAQAVTLAEAINEWLKDPAPGEPIYQANSY